MMEDGLGESLKDGVEGRFFHEVQVNDCLFCIVDGRTMVEVLGGSLAGDFLQLRHLLFSLLIGFCELPVLGSGVNIQVHQMVR